MRTWLVPGAENYFGRVNRAAILTAIDEAKGAHAPVLENLDKGELAVRAQDLLANTSWGAHLRSPSVGRRRRASRPSYPRSTKRLAGCVDAAVR